MAEAMQVLELTPCRNSAEATGVLTTRPGSGYRGVRSQNADAAPGLVRNEMKVLHGYGLSLILTAFLTSSQIGRTRASTRTREGAGTTNVPVGHPSRQSFGTARRVSMGSRSHFG